VLALLSFGDPALSASITAYTLARSKTMGDGATNGPAGSCGSARTPASCGRHGATDRPPARRRGLARVPAYPPAHGRL